MMATLFGQFQKNATSEHVPSFELQNAHKFASWATAVIRAVFQLHESKTLTGRLLAGYHQIEVFWKRFTESFLLKTFQWKPSSETLIWLQWERLQIRVKVRRPDRIGREPDLVKKIRIASSQLANGKPIETFSNDAMPRAHQLGNCCTIRRHSDRHNAPTGECVAIVWRWSGG